jgi:RNA polymerase sigma factor (sigma-70 family)
LTDQQREYERFIAPVEDRMMRAVWRITRNAADADDAFQDALLTIWKRWDRIRRHPNPHALILQISTNSAYDLLRRRVREGKWAGTLPMAGVPDSSASQLEGIAVAEQDARVLEAIGSLPEKQARAILLHAVEEMPYAEVAAAMECGEATVRKHVERARTKLRALLSSWFSSTRKEEERSHA